MKQKVYAGIDNLITIRDELVGLRLGLVSAPSGVDRNLRPTVDIINENFHLTALFGPEHGFRGEIQAGDHASGFRDPEYGVPVHSLYGSHIAPTPEMLERIDAVLFDIQDVGARYYTYLSTLAEVMKVCAIMKIPVYVFDRPNPIGLDRLEGNVLDERFSSFVGNYAIPVRYGMTIGEYGGYINAVKNIGCELTVVPCEGLKRTDYFEDTGMIFVPPSPNIPTPESALNYIGTCLIEGTNLSEGRGTTHPFDLIGAPWLRAAPLIEKLNGYGFDGVIFRRAYFTPSYSKYCGVMCEGIQLHITDPKRYQPFEVAMRMIDEIRANFADFKFTDTIDRLFGDDKLRTEYIGREKIDAFLAQNEVRIEKFKNEAKEYYLY